MIDDELIDDEILSDYDLMNLLNSITALEKAEVIYSNDERLSELEDYVFVNGNNLIQ